MVVEEREARAISGWKALPILIIGLIGGIVLIVLGCVYGGGDGEELKDPTLFAVFMVCGLALTVIAPVCMAGLKVLAPNEALVLTLFGKYNGTLKKDGFWFVNPFSVAIAPVKDSSGETGKKVLNKLISSQNGLVGKKLSLKAMTLNNDKQKVNDEEGNPIEISVVVIWRVRDTAKAVFAVDNYMTYISTQSDSAIRQVARQYPYDVSTGGDEKSLRGSAQEVSDVLKEELQGRVEMAGLEILEVRINNLAYAPEIASAMLQRQQASAIIAARQKIVDGAVSMVDMALKKLSENNIVELDDERKAAMVSNLLVVLCGNRDAQPIVNSGSIY